MISSSLGVLASKVIRAIATRPNGKRWRAHDETNPSRLKRDFRCAALTHAMKLPRELMETYSADAPCQITASADLEDVFLHFLERFERFPSPRSVADVRITTSELQ